MYNNNLNDPFLILFTKSSRIELLSVRINSFLFPSLFLTEFQLFPFETAFFLRRDFSSDIVLLIFTCRSCWNGLRAIGDRENKDLIKGNFNSEDRSEESDPDERSIYLVPDLCNKVLNFDSRIQNSLWLNPRSGFGYIWISDIYSRKNWNTKEKWKEVKEYSEFHRSKNQCRLWEGEKAFVGDIRKKVEHSSNSKIVERFTTRPSIRSFSFFFIIFVDDRPQLWPRFGGANWCRA